MGDSPRVPTPRGLAKRGRRFWRQVTSAYVLRPDELLLLENACRCVDLIVELEAGMAGQPLTVKGSMGQVREHPLLAEARQQRALLNRTLGQLKLPDEIQAPVNQHRAAAQSRWALPHGASPQALP